MCCLSGFVVRAKKKTAIKSVFECKLTCMKLCIPKMSPNCWLQFGKFWAWGGEFQWEWNEKVNEFNWHILYNISSKVNSIKPKNQFTVTISIYPLNVVQNWWQSEYVAVNSDIGFHCLYSCLIWISFIHYIAWPTVFVTCISKRSQFINFHG